MKKNILYVVIFLFLSSILTGTSVFSAEEKEIYIAKIDDNTINPVTAAYIAKAIKEAEKNKAECLIVELDTPGGLVSSTRTIVKKIIASEIPVIVYIYPSGARAGSAGVFITYASHIAAMAPSTNIGAAHPVKMGTQSKSIWDVLQEALKMAQGKKEDKIAEEEEKKNPLEDKILNDTVAFVKAMAMERNRNSEWAEKSITESASITEKEAKEKNVIEIIAKNEKDLIGKIDGMKIKINDQQKILQTKQAKISYIEMDLRQRILNVLANPNIAYLLMLLGFYGLLFEVTHPGVGFPGVAGAICLILAFFSLQMLPTNYAGVALIVLGLILFIAEAMVPGFGLLTLGGLVCMVLGSLILFKSSEQIMRVSLILIASVALTTATITIVLVRAVIISHRKKVISGQEGLIEARGHAKTHLIPGKEGKVFVHGEIWNAKSGEEIKKGKEIKVVKVDGMRLEVKRG